MYEQTKGGQKKDIFWYPVNEYKDAVLDAKVAMALGFHAMVFPEDLDFVWEEMDWYFLPKDRISFKEMSSKTAFGWSANGFDIEGDIVFDSDLGVFLDNWDVIDSETASIVEGMAGVKKLTHDEKAMIRNDNKSDAEKTLNEAWDILAIEEEKIWKKEDKTGIL